MGGVAQDDLETLRAKDALRTLVTRYSRAVDRRDLDMLRGLYAPDAFDHHGGMYEGGVDGYIAFLQGALARYEATTHYVVQCDFHVDFGNGGGVDFHNDEARAEGEIHKINYHRERAAPQLEVITGSRSLDHYVRRAGRWYFRSRAITLDWVRRRPVDPADYQDFAANSPLGRAGRDDPSFAALPMLCRHLAGLA